MGSSPSLWIQSRVLHACNNCMMLHIQRTTMFMCIAGVSALCSAQCPHMLCMTQHVSLRTMLPRHRGICKATQDTEEHAEGQ